MKRLALLFFILSPVLLGAQITISGKVISPEGLPQSKVQIALNEKDVLTITDSLGRFQFDFPFSAGSELLFFGYKNGVKWFGYRIEKVNADVNGLVIVQGEGMIYTPTVNITIGDANTGLYTVIKPRNFELNPWQGTEKLLMSLGLVSTNNELSTQFSVRGGNFDENLIYVNDIEIYRPQLISSGQQEGLSFINPDLVQNIKFSAGGFEAKYGDKMSSVLDVEYIRPDSNKVIINMGLMYNSLAIHAISPKKNVRMVFGGRYFTNRLVIGTFDVQGNYQMNFGDMQSFISYKPHKRWRVEFLGNVALNRYAVEPESRSTEFGTAQQAYQLDVGMGGRENMKYDYGMGAITLKFLSGFHSDMHLSTSYTGINESEIFDVEGAYRLSLLDRDLGSSNVGKPLRTLGFGYFLDHGRNILQTQLWNVNFGGRFHDKSAVVREIRYGVKWQQEYVNDRFHEWRYNDSDGYNIPPFGYASDSLILDDFSSARNTLNSQRLQAFVQSHLMLNAKHQWKMDVGVRTQYWSVNQQWLLMPRWSMTITPQKKKSRLDSIPQKSPTTYRMAVGAFHQAPFYRELRGFDGVLNKSLKAQESWHFIIGLEKIVYKWKRPFKWVSEAYFKQMNELVPFLYDNIRIRYFAQNAGKGYTWGWDNRFYGQFISGLESWFSLNIMQSKEQFTYTNNKGELATSDWLRRPTDKRVNAAITFQDEWPGNPTFRVNLSFILGTGMPYYFDGDFRFKSKPNTLPAYRRVDIGFSKILIKNKSREVPKIFRNIKGAWVSLDVFNLLAIDNVIAYTWVKDLENNLYGVPENLTGRRLNLRLHVEF